VGEKTVDLFDITPGESTQSTEVHLLSELRTATDVKMFCLPERLDDPSGHYEFSDVKVSRGPDYVGKGGSFDLSFDDRWLGVGVPGVRACEAVLLNSAGSAVLTHEFNFTDGKGASDDLRILLPVNSEISAVPESASISCQPTPKPG
jgi:hypothetical protein